MRMQSVTLDRACAAVDDAVEAVFTEVEAVRREVVRLVGAARDRRPRTTDLAPLEAMLRTALEGHESPHLGGLGYIAEVGVLEDAPRRLEWVRRTEAGALMRLEPDLDPDSFGYYDFTAAAWFRQPLSTGRRSVVGPYVDFAGTDEYVVTLTVPVEMNGRTLGVTGADLRPGELADAVMPQLCSLGSEVALVNVDHRVVVSTSPRWHVGALLRESPLAVAQSCTAVPWSVLALPAATE